LWQLLATGYQGSCNVCAKVPRESGPEGYLGAFSGVWYAWDRGLGFSPEAAPSWDASALFQRTRLGQCPAGTCEKQDQEENELLGRILDIKAEESYLLQGTIYSNRQTIVIYYNGTRMCLFGPKRTAGILGHCSEACIVPRHIALRHGAHGPRHGDLVRGMFGSPRHGLFWSEAWSGNGPWDRLRVIVLYRSPTFKSIFWPHRTCARLLLVHTNRYSWGLLSTTLWEDLYTGFSLIIIKDIYILYAYLRSLSFITKACFFGLHYKSWKTMHIIARVLNF